MRLVALLIILTCHVQILLAEEFSSDVRNVQISLASTHYKLKADLEYNLSPIAKEALQKGISLTWLIYIKVERLGFIWNSTLNELKIAYQIQNHALLNLYSVKSLSDGSTEMFTTLTAALNSISKIHNLDIISQDFIQSDQRYQVAIKLQFSREALPVPLRPLSYFDTQWALSSHWTLWPLQK